MRDLPKVTSVLVWLAVLGQLLYAGSKWRAYVVFKDDPQSYDPLAMTAIDAIYGVVGLAAAVTFIVWLRKVRAAAERFTKAPHRHGRGWVIAGWLIPIISLWYPKQIVDDIVAASNPRTSPQAETLPTLRSSVVQVWWATWIASTLVEFADPGFFADQPSARDLVTAALASTAAAVLSIVCAVYAVRVIQLITNLQASRPQTAWWETDSSPASAS